MRTAYRQQCWDAAVASFAGLEDARLLFQFCDTPRDVERRFGTTRRGLIRQGALVAGQTFLGRPHRSCSSGRTPWPGSISGRGGAPRNPRLARGGYNAAAAVAEDLGLPWSL